MGGSTMKTAKVWKYFDQLPSEEQAAECRICCKRIKATNSSTTGMIRHLRSCHVNEYKLLQEARQSGLVMKQEEKCRLVPVKQQPQQPDIQKQQMKLANAHSISNIMASQIQPPVIQNAQSCSVPKFDGPPIKRTKIDDVCDAIDLSTSRRACSELSRVSGSSSEKNRKVKENFWPDEHPEAKKITNQVGLMMLLDGETPLIADRAGFRGLLRLLQPKYRMPSGETFQKTILPELFGQLKTDLSVFQQDFFQNRFDKATVNTAPASLKVQRDFTVMCTEPSNIFARNFATHSVEQNDLERVVMNSIRCAQNISQSFSHSIQLCDEDSDSSADLESALPTRIAAFLERIGKYVFPQAELVDILTRCHSAVQYLEECQDLPDALKTSAPTNDLAACVDFVKNNLDAIHSLHNCRAIPSFIPFSSDETQFLSDLNAHIRTT